MGWKSWAVFFCSLWMGAESIWGIAYTPLGPHGEGGALHGQTFDIGPGGGVYELDAFLHIGGMDLNGAAAGTSAKLSTDALPAGLTVQVTDWLSTNKQDMAVIYMLSNTSASATFADASFFVYFDAEIDEDLNTFFNEFGVMSGTAGSGAGDHAADFWQIDEPGFAEGTLIDQILAGTLINTNRIPLSSPNDVAMGLGFGLGDVGPGQSRRMRIMVSEAGNSIGLLSLRHQDVDPESTTTITLSGQEGIFLSLNVNSSGASGVPVGVSPADGSGLGNGETDFRRDYVQGTVVTLAAAATAGAKQFSSWTGVDSQTGLVAVVTLNADRTATARYIDVPRTLTVQSAGASGVPVAMSPPDRTGAGNGTTIFTRSYTNGARVTLVAAAAAGERVFSGWSGVDSQNGVTGTVALAADRTVTANYADPPRTLTVQSAGASGVPVAVSPPDRTGAGNGTTIFARSYTNGARVTLVAAATAEGQTFTGWSGVDSQNGVTGTVALAADRTVSANYSQNAWGALDAGFRWRLDMGTGALVGTLAVSNPATATRRFAMPAWLVLHASPDFHFTQPAGALPSGDGYMVITAAMRADLRGAGNRDDLLDPGESVAIEDLAVYSRYRRAPADSQFELWMTSDQSVEE